MDGATALALALGASEEETPQKNKRTKRAKQWFLQSQKINFGRSKLLEELRNNEPVDYENFLRMDGDSIDELFIFNTIIFFSSSFEPSL